MKIHDYINNTSTEWQVLPLKNIIKEVKLKNNSKENITVFAVTKHSGLVPSLKFFKKKVFSIDLSNYKIIKNGQFAYSPIHLNEGAIGLLETQQRGLVSPLHIVFKILPDLHSSFFKILFKTNRFISTCSRFAQGSVHRRGAVSYRDFSNIHVPVPPLVEQRGIVEVLGTVDECIRLTDAVIERAEELKRGLMQQLLTRGIGHTEYKETSLGKIPKTWKTEKLGNVLQLCEYGLSYSLSREGKYPVFRMNNLENGYVIENDLKFVNLSDKKFQKYRLHKGDILFNRTNSYNLVGKVGIYLLEGDHTFASYLIRLQTKPKLDPKFLNFFMNLEQSQNYLRRLATRGVSQSNINAQSLKSLNLLLPPIHEQLKIIKLLENQDNVIGHENQKKKHLNLVKQGLMQVLLSGKIRVELKGDGLHRIGDRREANN